ncbi:MAG: DUF805 domain-containing protein [Muribaculaceae bacterium]|nr:DUF805 domain-containing protein [Muribaculaceae bacterium]
MTFSQAISSFYRNYANFNGRAGRAAYWWVALYTFIVTVVCYILIMACGGDIANGQLGFWGWFWYAVLWVFGLINIVPGLALGWRRMHDIGKGGGWIFITFVPLIGSIWFLVLTLTPGQPGPNRFGEPNNVR